MKAFYFGCWGGTGHFLCDERGRMARRDNGSPWTEEQLDTGFCPGMVREYGRLVAPREQPEGAARLVHERGWTALAFWDRSVDSRGSSNSCFVLEGEHDFEATVRLARERFPSVWSRFRFDVRLA